MPSWLVFVTIGIIGGIASGFLGLFVCGLGVYLIYGACKRLGRL